MDFDAVADELYAGLDRGHRYTLDARVHRWWRHVGQHRSLTSELAMTVSGRAASTRIVPVIRPGTIADGISLGLASMPSITNSPICASHAAPSANPLVAARCGSRELPRIRAVS